MNPKSERLLDKARRAIESARRDLNEGDADFAASRAYYAMFYVADAVLADRDLRFRKHSGVHRAFGQHFARTKELDPRFHQWLLEAFAVRLEGDDRLNADIEPDQVETTIEQAEEFLAAVRDYLESTSDEDA